MPEYGIDENPYPNTTDIPDGPDAFLKLAQRMTKMKGGGIGYAADATALAALITDGDAFTGLTVYHAAADCLVRYNGSAFKLVGRKTFASAGAQTTWNSSFSTLLEVGSLSLRIDSGIEERWAGSAWVIAATHTNLTPTSIVPSVGSASPDATGKVVFSGITTGGTLRINCDKATLAQFTRIHVLIDAESSTAGQTIVFDVKLADGATVNSAAGSYVNHSQGLSAGTAAPVNGSGASWGVPVARRYLKGFRLELTDMATAHETHATWKGTGYDLAQTNLYDIIGGHLGHKDAALAADGWQLVFIVSGGATAVGSVRIIGEL